MPRKMSQNELPRNSNSNFWPTTPYSFDVPPGLGLLNEDFEFPEDNSQGNNTVEEVVIPTTQTQQPPTFPISQQSQPQCQPLPSQQILPTENDVSSFPDPYLPNDSSIIDYNLSPTYQPLAPPPIPSNSRYLYPPTPIYLNHPYYNSNMLQADPELFSKYVAEEDKRRRNTAASARFRIKKKMREQALEKTAREMTTKAEMLENRVKELEREIKWLKNLLIEKDTRILDIQHSDNFKHKDGGDKNKNDKNLASTSDQQHQM
ncbi:hypothetical protein C1645_769600 [Glomus cerebriforme]|uniref:BZIP domain-containing protein n=1 Tax=Glomus cerebriforme TaxID=658196 RepID=A0A397SX63_9GLOM|nr:hypothetical protein C1645_769600 [Glomus cerebriforme]